MFKKFQKILIFVFLLSIVFVFGNTILAQVDTGIAQVAGTGLGDTDPRVIIANVIRIFLGFLGIIALVLILYAGFLWTTSGGEPSKVDKAKKILSSAVIGLIIILSAFAIASFILSRMLSATGAVGSIGSDCDTGDTNPNTCMIPTDASCSSGFCNTLTCTCQLGTNTTTVTPLSCDANTFTLACEDDGSCDSMTQFCDGNSGCTCQSLGGLGDPCDSNFPLTAMCTTPEDGMCMPDLICDINTCLCDGPPIIDWLDPVNATSTPYGAEGDFVTIGGRYFGATEGEVYFTGTPAGVAGRILAPFPDTVNANCTNNWTNNQIIVVVPVGAQDGPVWVVRDVDLAEDATDTAPGNMILDFMVTSTNRPGLCLANPNFGFFEDPFNLQGIYFNGTTQGVYFGSSNASTTADGMSGWTASSVDAIVPRISRGVNSVFLNVDDAVSNSLRFIIEVDNSRGPVIDYMQPNPTVPGQYVTIFGRNFGRLGANSDILFTDGVSDYSPDGTDFHIQCQDSWWRDTYIIMKTPDVITSFVNHNIVITNNNTATSAPSVLSVLDGDPGPGICKINPNMGPVGFAPVSIYGDSFWGTPNPGVVDFFNSPDATTTLPWNNKDITTGVPAGALSGPVNVIVATTSNPMPFRVGTCDPQYASSSPLFECDLSGPEECCGPGTYWDGICRLEGGCNDGGGVVDSGFGWTYYAYGTTTTPVDPNLTCSGWSSGNACLVSDQGCPNSPGECQTDPAPFTGFCGDPYCENLSPCTGGNCTYDNATNRCIASASVQMTCDQTLMTDFASLGSPYPLPRPYSAVCSRAAIGPGAAWQINTGGSSCPTGAFLDNNGWCTLGTTTPALFVEACDVCDSGFSCSSGSCVIEERVCGSDSTCIADECIGPATCECCCEVSANDCCLGTECLAGGCGGPLDQTDYGLCTGCRIEIDNDYSTFDINEQIASDFACNCEGTNNKFCMASTTPFVTSSDPLYSGVCLDLPPPPPLPPDSCDDPTIPNVGICDPDHSQCPGGYCDSNCTCQATSTYPGALCIQDQSFGMSSVYTCNPFACGTGYDCRDGIGVSSIVSSNNPSDCGTCCCDPTTTPPQQLGTLTCTADRSPCDGVTRGLYCGCSLDTECASTPDTVACGNDTCCRTRPEVNSSSPADDSTDVCRNILIEATFDVEMDISTFRGNLVVFGDYGTNPCPQGTSYLAFGEDVFKKGNQNIIAKYYNIIKEKITSTIFGKANAYQVPSVTSNYCAIRGKTDGYNDSSGQGVLSFSPSKALDGEIVYYVVIKGDSDLGDSSSMGVLDKYGISMGTNATVSETFSTVAYNNSYIWSFETMSDQGEDQGICTIDYVKVVPESYLIQTTENSLLEDDTNPISDSFDSIKDADKLFVAKPKTMSGQTLTPVVGLYDWTWSWNLTNQTIATSVSVATLGDDRNLVRAKNTATDGKTFVLAIVHFLAGPFTTGFETKTGEASLYLFLCDNPWPQIDSSTGNWSPWQDDSNNCSPGLEGGGCSINANYEFYYCRDQGSVSTYDDLPPILNNAVIRGRDDKQNLFKEYYFFREDTPTMATTTITATSTLVGGSAEINWSNFIEENGQTLREFIIYYGSASGNYTNSIVSPRPPIGAPAIGSPIAGSIIVPDLRNDRRYYFSMTAVYENDAESELNEELIVIPKDSVVPISPVISSITASDAEVEIKWNPITDAVSYNLYWKAGLECIPPSPATPPAPPDCYASFYNVGNVTTVTVDELINDTIYYFAVTAIDSSGNESPYSNEVGDTPIAFAPIIPGVNQVQIAQKDILPEGLSEDQIVQEENGIVAGAFEENNNEDLDSSESNRINLFGDIVKYIFKKISYTVTNKVEAKDILE